MAKKAPVQTTLSFDESESGGASSFISPVRDPNPLPKKEPDVLTVAELGERIRDDSPTLPVLNSISNMGIIVAKEKSVSNDAKMLKNILSAR